MARSKNHQPDTPAGLPPALKTGLGILVNAYEYARDLRRCIWDFAVEIQTLRKAGVVDSDLRWLACKGYIEHGTEIAPRKQERRSFRRSARLRFTDRTGIVLTEEGARFALAAVEGQGGARKGKGQAGGRARRPAGRALVPSWDAARRELRLGDQLVKQFRQPAPDQETILAAFQEEGWPTRIDDPLAPRRDQDSKRHLHNTINNLNRHQKNHLIRFRGDGHGQGVRWEIVSQE